MAPILEFFDHFNATIPVGDIALPIKVKRLSRAPYEKFATEWQRLVEPRGTEPLAPEAAAAHEAEQTEFFERSIRELVSFAPGVLQVNGADVLDGAGFLELFHARVDILSAALLQVHIKNALCGVTKKISSLPLASATGSEAKSTDAGSAPAPTAAPAGSSSTAPTEAVTAS